MFDKWFKNSRKLPTATPATESLAESPATLPELIFKREGSQISYELLAKTELTQVFELAVPRLVADRLKLLAVLNTELEKNDKLISHLTMQREDILSVVEQENKTLDDSKNEKEKEKKLTGEEIWL